MQSWTIPQWGGWHNAYSTTTLTGRQRALTPRPHKVDTPPDFLLLLLLALNDSPLCSLMPSCQSLLQRPLLTPDTHKISPSPVAPSPSFQYQPSFHQLPTPSPESRAHRGYQGPLITNQPRCVLALFLFDFVLGQMGHRQPLGMAKAASGRHPKTLGRCKHFLSARCSSGRTSEQHC